jgi:hypothetical protein
LRKKAAGFTKFEESKVGLKKKISLLLVATIGIPAVMMLLQPLFFPWSPINCWEDSIDIAGGRYRYHRYLFWIPVAERIEDTPLTERYRKLIGEPPDPIWRRVNTFSPGVHHSPHYFHHGSLYAAKKLDAILNANRFTDEARACAIKEFLHRLQTDDDDFKVSDFVMQLRELLNDDEKANRSIQAKDIASLSPSP